MAFEKILNTRIALKIDTLENWGKSTLVLKRGELAFATVAATAGTALTEPVIMVKIGDGEHTFSQLTYDFYAKASDVLAACKSEASLKEFINGVIADAGIASDEAMQELSDRVTTAEGKIVTLEGNIVTLNGDGEGSVAKKIADAIAALNLAGTYEAKGEAAKVQSELNSYKESNDIALAGVKATAEAAYVKPVAGIPKSDLDAGVQLSLGKADTALQSHQDISHLAVKSEVETELGKKVDVTAYNTKVGELETAIGGKVDKVEGKSLISDSEITRLASVTNYDDTQVKADIANKADAATMTTELGKKVDKVEGYSLVSDTEIARLAQVDNYDDSALAGRVKAIEDDYLKAEDKYDDSALVGRVEALEGASATHALKTEVEAVQGEVDALEGYVGTFTASEGVDTVVKYIDAKTANIASDERVSDIENRVKAIEDDYLVESDKTELAGLISAEQQRAEGIEGGLETRLAAVEGDYLKGADKTALQNQITANANAIELLTNGASAEEVDGVNDLIQYVKDHGTEVTGMKADIKTNSDAIAAINDGTTGILATAKGYADSLASNYAEAEHNHEIGEVNGLEIALAGKADEQHGHEISEINKLQDALDAKASTDSVTTLENEIAAIVDGDTVVAKATYADGAGYADEAASAENAVKLGGKEASLYALKTDLSGKADSQHGHEIDEVDGLQDALNAKANDADLKAVAKSGLIDDLSIGEGTVLIFDCGTSV